MADFQKIFGGLLGSGAVRERDLVASQMAQMQTLSNYSTSAFSPGSFIFHPERQEFSIACSPSAVKAEVETRRVAVGEYRRTPREGELRYKDSPLEWLDQRVLEMQVCL